jgi:ferrous iron transport protein B
MVLMFQSIFSWAEPVMSLIDGMFGALSGWVAAMIPVGPFQSLLTDGVIGGVGSVLVFLPQIVVLFLFIAIIEDSGYMPRAAFLVDRLFSWCGLSGKSFIPMLSSFACAIPGIMATRTIEDRKLRLLTILVSPLMSCSARLPVYTIMIAAFIPHKSVLGLFNTQGLLLTGLYLLGIVVAIVVSYILNRTILKTDRGTFMMEMPSYKLPTPSSVLIRIVNRVKMFVIRAGTIILAITVLIWALSYYPHSEETVRNYDTRITELTSQHETEVNNLDLRLDGLLASETDRDIYSSILSSVALTGTSKQLAVSRESLLTTHPEKGTLIDLAFRKQEATINYQTELAGLENARAGELIRNSYLGRTGRTIEPIFRPLGWDWKITMATLSAFPAREVIIATLGTIYNLGSDVNEESLSLVDKMRLAKWEDGELAGQPVFTPPVALSIVIFFALCCQCGATLVTIRQESGSWKYPIGTFVYMTVLAYLSAMVVYQLFSRMGM